MKEKKARVQDALHATRAAVEQGVVAEALLYLRTQKPLGDEAVGAEIVFAAHSSFQHASSPTTLARQAL